MRRSFLAVRAYHVETFAVTVLDLVCEEGLDVIQSCDEAARLYNMTADQGYAQAQRNLDNMYFAGDFPPLRN